MKCSSISKILFKYASNELDAAKIALVDSHLIECANCKNELAKITRAVRALEMPVRRFEAPDMLIEIKRQATQPKHGIFSAFPIRVMAYASLIILIGISAAILPRLGNKPQKVEMAYKQTATISPQTLISKQSKCHPQPDQNSQKTISVFCENGKVAQTSKEIVKQNKSVIHKRIPTIQKAKDEIAKVDKTECGAQVTIMDPAEFEANRAELSAKAPVIISGSPDSALLAEHQLTPAIIAYRSFDFRYRSQYLQQYSTQPKDEENQNELP